MKLTLQILWWVVITVLLAPLYFLMVAIEYAGNAAEIRKDELCRFKHRIAPSPEFKQ